MLRYVCMDKLKLRLLQAAAIVLISVGVGLLFYKLRPSADSTIVAAKAFPSAEGFGAETIGGRGGRVIEVTNLLDRVRKNGNTITAPGSLRAALEAKGPRIVVFNVSGTIDLGRTEIWLTEPYVTVAGQTAPGDGITVTNGWIPITAHDVIFRNFRIRPGPGGYDSRFPTGARANAVEILSNNGRTAKNIIMDHMSISWGTDELFTVCCNVTNVTLQNSVVSEAMNCVPPPYSHDPPGDIRACHSIGTFISYGATDITMHHNLFAHAGDRNPLITGGKVDFVNNIIYNFGRPTNITPINIPVLANFIGNIYKFGPNGPTDGAEIRHNYSCEADRPCAGDQSGVFAADNLGSDKVNGPFRPGKVLCAINNRCFHQPTVRFSYPAVTTQSVIEAYDTVLQNAGAIKPKRDTIDERVVNDVKNGTGKIIDQPSDVGGLPELKSTTPPVDSDHDGMPDDWEKKHGLDPSLALDGSDDGTKDGYTNVEKYLNELARDVDYGDQQFEVVERDPEPDPLLTDIDDREPSPEPDPLPTDIDDGEPSPESSHEPSETSENFQSPEPNTTSDANPSPPTPESSALPVSQVATSFLSTPSPRANSSTATQSPQLLSLPISLDSRSARLKDGNNNSVASSAATSSLKPLILVYPLYGSDQSAVKTEVSSSSSGFIGFIQTIITGFNSLFR